MEQHSVLSADGTRIVWTTLGAGDGVVICPGSLSDGSDWMPVATRLAEVLKVHVMSRRGTGASGDAAEHSIQRESEDVTAVLAAAGAHRLVGHSYGAVCSLEAASGYSALERLVLYEPPLGVDAPVVPTDALEEIERAGARGDVETVVDTGLRRCVRLPDAVVDGLRRSPAWDRMVANGRQWPREMRAIAGRPPGVTEHATIPASTLLLVGEQTPPGHHHRTSVDALAATIPGARVQELSGVGHEGHAQDPAALAATLLAFLA